MKSAIFAHFIEKNALSISAFSQKRPPFHPMEVKIASKIVFLGMKSDARPLKLEKMGVRSNLIRLVISELPAYFSQAFFCFEKKYSSR